MVTLRRTVRVWVNLNAAGRAVDAGPSYNAYAGRPTPIGLGRFFEIQVACRGEPDPRTGYLINIKEIDRAVREGALPLLVDACADPTAAGPHALSMLVGRVAALLPVDCRSVTLRPSPYHSYEMGEDASTSTGQTTDAVLLRTAFDLAAAHRLNAPDLTPAQNLELFGKCNNPAGHGHNYRVEPCVALDLATLARHPFTIRALEEATNQAIISRFDHKHLNLDTPEFADAGGVNPTVENIARVFFGLLAPAIREASAAATLRSITVWETDRTCATYPG